VSKGKALGLESAARVLILGLLAALPVFAGHLQMWETLAAAGAVALCAVLALAEASRAGKPDLPTTSTASRAAKPDLHTTSTASRAAKPDLHTTSPRGGGGPCHE